MLLEGVHGGDHGKEFMETSSRKQVHGNKFTERGSRTIPFTEASSRKGDHGRYPDELRYSDADSGMIGKMNEMQRNEKSVGKAQYEIDSKLIILFTIDISNSQTVYQDPSQLTNQQLRMNNSYEWDHEDETQRHSASAIAGHFERLNEYEARSLGQLAKLQEEKETLLRRLVEIRLQRVQWTEELKFELDRRNRRAEELDEAEDERQEDEKYRREQEEHAISRCPHDKNHLVGYFVRVDFFGEWFGVIIECVEKGIFSIIGSDGRISLVDFRAITIREPTEADRKAFKDLGYLTHLLPPLSLL
jgi:hypothetical protein